jgi:hypothetical protein
MIENMALLKQAMAEMDAEDPDAAQAAKDRAAQTLSAAKLSFSKIAELIEQRRLLLRPRIVSGIKRMDQPGMLGDAAFRDASSALRREGQSFGQIAEALELTSRPAPSYGSLASETGDLTRETEPSDQMGVEPLYQIGSEPVEPVEPAWLRVLVLVGSLVFFPLRHPIRFLAIVLVIILLFYALRGFFSLGEQVSERFDSAAVRHGADKAMSSVSSFVNDQILRRSKQTAAPTSPTASPSPSPSSATPSATPSAAPDTASAPPAAAPAPPAKTAAGPAPSSATPVPPSAVPAHPPVSAPRREARGAPPAKATPNCGVGREDLYGSSRRCAPPEDNRSDNRSRALEDFIPESVRRRSTVAGPCVGGVGGCYWGGTRY